MPEEQETQDEIELTARLMFVAGKRNGVAYYHSKSTVANVTVDDMRAFGRECVRLGAKYVRDKLQEIARVEASDRPKPGSYDQMVREPTAYFSSELAPLPQLAAAAQVLADSGLVDWQADDWEVVELAARVLELNGSGKPVPTFPQAAAIRAK
jgi:hypothetical protein